MAVLTLADVAKSCVAVKVRLAGQEFDAVPLTALETAELLAFCPQPLPPLIKVLDAPNNAPKIENMDDAGYKAAFARWNARLTLTALAVAISKGGPSQLDGVGAWKTPGPGTEQDNRRFLDGAAAMLGGLGAAEVNAASVLLRSALAEASEKASGN